jgi:hypothetical protein
MKVDVNTMLWFHFNFSIHGMCLLFAHGLGIDMSSISTRRPNNTQVDLRSEEIYYFRRFLRLFLHGHISILSSKS